MTVGPAPQPAQQRGRDEVHRGLAPARALHHQGSALLSDQRLDGVPLVLAQPRVARRGADEAGEHGIGGRTQILAVRGGQVFVAHGPMQPDASDIARTSGRTVDSF